MSRQKFVVAAHAFTDRVKQIRFDRLRRLLSKYVSVILLSEFRSSQRSACCHSHLANRPSPKRVTVKQCTACKTLLSRDVSADCIISDIFEFQRQNQTKELPEFIYQLEFNDLQVVTVTYC
jgi:hypothetical protein